jgi:preprotein translocase subunit YajC
VRKFSSRKIIIINFLLIILLLLFFLFFFFSINDQKVRENYHPPTYDGDKVIPGFFGDENK